MQWVRQGHIYSPDGTLPWARTHAFCPTPFLTADQSRIRVLVSSRDEDQIGRCGWVDLDAEDPGRVIDVGTAPALDVGEAGTFDEHGVTPLSLIRLASGRLRLYYVGWQRAIGVRYFLFSGIAESDDDGMHFARVQRVPALERSDTELHARTVGLVRQELTGYRMWYSGGSGWDDAGDRARPRYSIRTIFSTDGLQWPGEGREILAPRPDEHGLGRPCIIESPGRHRMWFGRRERDTGRYRLAYAESADGFDWTRMDADAGLDLAESGAWDSEMVGTSALLKRGDDTLLFYNGNGFGATGFGWAIAEGL